MPSKVVKEIDDLQLVPCAKHKQCIVGCKHCRCERTKRTYTVKEKPKRKPKGGLICQPLDSS